jgi:hypothetical protein
MALSLVGVCLALLFVVLGAPDDAHAEVMVGAIALPTLYLLAIGKTRADVEDTGELGEPADPPESHRSGAGHARSCGRRSRSIAVVGTAAHRGGRAAPRGR